MFFLVTVMGALAMAALAVPRTRSLVMERLPSRWRIGLSAWQHGVVVNHDVTIATADGVRLTASLYLPKSVSGPLPTILIRLPYHRLHYGEGYSFAVFFAENGYAALVQDLRGTGDSGGELLPWQHAEEDGLATLDWIVRQPWSSGKVGTFGCSALGETQLVLAKRNHPAHQAMIPSGAGGAVGSALGRHAYFGVFEGGVFQLASGFGWFVDSGAQRPGAPPAAPFERAAHLARLPVSGLVQEVRPAPNGFDEFLATPPGDPRWAQWGYLGDGDRSGVPALIVNTWGDQGVGDTLALAEAWRRADPAAGARQKVVISPGNHCHHEDSANEVRFGALAVEGAARPYRDWYLAWFDHWLRGRGDGLSFLRAFNFFMLGENQWLAADEWPPAEARVERWHLDSHGHANSRGGDGALLRQAPAWIGRDLFTYDPLHPVPSRGGPVCCTGDPRTKAGPADQADVESRSDVLVYTSAPLERDLRIAGPLRARLTVSSDAPDTDLVARLVHLHPDASAISIQEGALRLRYRDGFERPVLMERGRRYEVAVDMRAIAYTIPRGHRLRLHVTSSSFPRLERNLNTGAPNNAAESRSVAAQNEVHHGPGIASYLELPVLPPRP